MSDVKPTPESVLTCRQHELPAGKQSRSLKAKRRIQPVEFYLDADLQLLQTGEVGPVICKSKGQFDPGHFGHICRKQVMATDYCIMQGIFRRAVSELLFPLVAFAEPLPQLQQTIDHLTFFFRGFLRFFPETFAQIVKNVIVINQINAGRQLSMCAAGRQVCMCIHRFSFKNVDMNMLSAPSFRGRQTYRSENVQTVSGSLLPAAVRLAPFTYVCVNVNSLKGRDLSCEASVMKRPTVMPSLSGGAYV